MHVTKWQYCGHANKYFKTKGKRSKITEDRKKELCIIFINIGFQGTVPRKSISKILKRKFLFLKKIYRNSK